MSTLLVGDKSRFAIESYIAQPFERLSERALGYFIVYVGGQAYGVQSPEATLLACSFDAVGRRLARRGTHIVSFGAEASVEELVYAVHMSLYVGCSPEVQFWGLSEEDLIDELVAHDIIFAPDGDAAFDDGGNILQFDLGEFVRLVAFNNSSDVPSGTDALVDIKMDAVEFYQVLESWRGQFELAWHRALVTKI